MYLISQAKLRKAKQDLSNTRPYFDALQNEIGRVFNADAAVESRYLEPVQQPARRRYCVRPACSSQRTRALPARIIKTPSARPSSSWPTTRTPSSMWWASMAAAGSPSGISPIEKSFLYTAQNPTLGRARQIAELLLERYDADEINAVVVIYTDMKNGLEAVVRQAQLLPLHRERFIAAAANTAKDDVYEFIPSPRRGGEQRRPQLPDRLHLQCAGGQLCSEQSARMTAMNAADQNAEELLKDLSVQFNRARQAAITQEITEVSAGERAQRSKKEKRRATSDETRNYHGHFRPCDRCALPGGHSARHQRSADRPGGRHCLHHGGGAAPGETRPSAAS